MVFVTEFESAVHYCSRSLVPLAGVFRQVAFQQNAIGNHVLGRLLESGVMRRPEMIIERTGEHQKPWEAAQAAKPPAY
jgi:hypothetical protein